MILDTQNNGDKRGTDNGEVGKRRARGDTFCIAFPSRTAMEIIYKHDWAITLRYCPFLMLFDFFFLIFFH